MKIITIYAVFTLCASVILVACSDNTDMPTATHPVAVHSDALVNNAADMVSMAKSIPLTKNSLGRKPLR